MARDLTPIFQDLPLSLEAYRLRAGDTGLHDFTAELDAGVEIEDLSADPSGVWKGKGGLQHTHRARLALGADGFTKGTTVKVRTPSITASKLRAWYAIEVFYLEQGSDDDSPEGTVRFRLWDGSEELYWDGAAWSSASLDAHVNTAAELMANAASLPGTVRELAVVALLQTTSVAYTPLFFGARVAYGVATLGCDDDAQVRTLIRELRNNLAATSRMEFQTDGSAGFAVPPVEALGPSDAGPYDVQSVDAVFNLTDDPDEETELSGTLAGGTWTPDSALPAGKHLRLEFTHAVDCVLVRHRDATKLRRIPSLVLAVQAESTQRGGEPEQVRNITASPPTSMELDAPDWKTVQLEVRIVCEFWRDLSSILRAWRAFMGGQGHRVLLSPETGRAVELRQIGEFQDVSGVLALGVVESRGTVRLSYAVARRDTTVARPLVRTGGVSLSTQSTRSF